MNTASDQLSLGSRLHLTGLSIVVPAYKSEKSLPLLIGELMQILGNRKYEIILVNDGSPDRTWNIITEFATRFPVVRGICLTRNYGQHNALLCGIRAARYDAIVTMDDDLQNPPREVLRLVSKLEEGWDVVYGTPRHESHGLFRNIASQITKLALQDAMGVKTARSVSAFRAFRTALRPAFTDYDGPYVSIDALLTWATTRFAAIPVDNPSRTMGASNYTVRALLTHAINMMTGFSTMPLQVASVLGFMLTLFGTGVLLFVLGRYLIESSTVPGFPFLASVVSIFSGAQLFALGVIGEYLARIHFRTMRRPTYVVLSSTEEPDQSAAHAAAKSDVI